MKLPFALAKRFVAGETFDEAVPEVESLNKKQIAVTLDLLGENVEDRATADQNVLAYCNLLNNIKESKLNGSISIKLTMLGLDIDRSYCKDNLLTLLEVAKENDQFVRIDMEGSNYTQLTIDLFKEAFDDFGSHVGVVIQAYLHRSKDDIEELARMNADVRLCKGAYNEPKSIAIQNMDEIRKAYKDYAVMLIAKTTHPRIATHDDEMINFVKDYVFEHEHPKNTLEFQMLYGLRQETMVELAAQGYNTRIYVPYGTMWFPYFKRRLTERKENIWFVASTLFKK